MEALQCIKSTNLPVVSNEVGNEVIIINLISGCYYYLDPFASALWNLIASGADIYLIKNVLKEQGSLRNEDIDSMIDEFVGKLTKEGPDYRLRRRFAFAD